MPAATTQHRGLTDADLQELMALIKGADHTEQEQGGQDERLVQEVEGVEPAQEVAACATLEALLRGCRPVAHAATASRRRQR